MKFFNKLTFSKINKLKKNFFLKIIRWHIFKPVKNTFDTYENRFK